MYVQCQEYWVTDSTSRTIIVTDQFLSESGPTSVREVAVDPRSLKDSTSPDAVIISSRAKPSGTGTVRFGEACVAISFRSVQNWRFVTSRHHLQTTVLGIAPVTI